jgi:peptidoglycan-associated lipoprotein
LLSCAAALGLLSACADTHTPSSTARLQKAARPAPIVNATVVNVPHEPPRMAAAPAPAPVPAVEALPPTSAGPQEDLPSLVQFDFDAYQVKEPYRAMLQAHARRLLAEPQLKLLIQAHADSRGHRDYNQALASKRAEMVKKQLLGLGVPPAQLQTSVAEAARHSAGSRRVELIYR